MSAYAPLFNYFNKMYSTEAYPVLLTAKFTVTPTNGLGITSLTGGGIANVFMHTSTTPAVGNGSLTNPNPASGIIAVQLSNNFSKLLSMSATIEAPTATTLTATTINVTYVITALGTATTAQWVAKGLPVGVTPAVGQAFVATASGTIGGSATVQTPTTSGISAVEVVGNPNVSLQNSNIRQNGGGQILLQCMAPSITMGAYTPAGTNSAPALTMNAYTPAGTNDGSTPPLFTGTPATLTGTVAAPTFTGNAASLTGTNALVKTAPAAGSIITLSLLLSNSSVTVNGQ